MDVGIVTTIFMWCTILNVVLLVVSSLVCMFAGDWVYGIHSKWFSVSRKTFKVAFYSFIGVYKILILVFNFVPYVALLIVG